MSLAMTLAFLALAPAPLPHPCPPGWPAWALVGDYTGLWGPQPVRFSLLPGGHYSGHQGLTSYEGTWEVRGPAVWVREWVQGEREECGGLLWYFVPRKSRAGSPLPARGVYPLRPCPLPPGGAESAGAP